MSHDQLQLLYALQGCLAGHRRRHVGMTDDQAQDVALAFSQDVCRTLPRNPASSSTDGGRR